MTPSELRALADALEPMAAAPVFERLDIPGAVAFLRQCAEQRPDAWMYEHDGCVDTPIITASRWAKCEEPWTETALYLHPVPQPQPVLSGYGDYGAAIPGIERPCTCHPDDSPPVPCAQQYALNECRAVHGEPTEAQIAARDALLDFISENGTASEGVQHYLDRYVRAALAAKDDPT